VLSVGEGWRACVKEVVGTCEVVVVRYGES